MSFIKGFGDPGAFSEVCTAPAVGTERGCPMPPPQNRILCTAGAAPAPLHLSPSRSLGRLLQQPGLPAFGSALP